MRQQKKCRILILAIMIISLGMMGCNLDQIQNKVEVQEEPTVTPKPLTEIEDNSYNSAFKQYDEDITELGLVINEPNEETIESLPVLETYTQTNGEAYMLIVPKHNGSKVTVSKAEFTGERLVPKEVLYSNEKTPEGYGLLVHAMRPEGIPEIMVTITYKNKSIDYTVAEDGKNGYKAIEYLRLKTEGANTSYESETITPIQDSAYLEGLNLFSQFEVDFDMDGNEEMLEVYCQAEKNEAGQYIFDDGQVWTLIIRKGDAIYPLFEKSYIQLGGLEYLVYVDYDDYERVHIMIEYKAGAGRMTFDCVYDEAENTFKRQTIYEASNINILKEWKF